MLQNICITALSIGDNSEQCTSLLYPVFSIGSSTYYDYKKSIYGLKLEWFIKTYETLN